MWRQGASGCGGRTSRKAAGCRLGADAVVWSLSTHRSSKGTQCAGNVGVGDQYRAQAEIIRIAYVAELAEGQFEVVVSAQDGWGVQVLSR
jgi:hypothetical protein